MVALTFLGVLGLLAVACSTKLESRCGDGVLGVGEECDDGNASSSDLCTNSCRAAFCGDGFIQPGEECDDAAQNSDERSGACRTACLIYRCGDDVTDLDHGEECDYGDDNSDALPNACRSACLLPTCGDLVIDQGEQCDDGNTNPNDECDACVASTCGNAEVEPGEGCDDGNRLSGDGCTGDCFVEAVRCGDGLVQAPAESCDDGNLDDLDCCSALCAAEPGCEVEPNNTPFGVVAFESIQLGGGVDALIYPAGDEDHYPFTIPAGQRVAVVAYTTTGPLGSSCGSLSIESELELWRMDVAGLPQIIASDYGPGRCSVVRATGLGPGEYLLKVRAWPFDPVSFDYRLQLALQPVLLEVEPNDAPDPLLPRFIPGSLVEGDLGPDPDWYRIELAETSDLQLQTWTPPGPGSCVLGIHTRVDLRHADGSLIASDAAGGLGYCSNLDGAVRGELTALQPGTYYAVVTDEGSTSGSKRYVLDVGRLAVCGDDAVTNSETCDDGNVLAGDGCSSKCRIE